MWRDSRPGPLRSGTRPVTTLDACSQHCVEECGLQGIVPEPSQSTRYRAAGRLGERAAFEVPSNPGFKLTAAPIGEVTGHA